VLENDWNHWNGETFGTGSSWNGWNDWIRLLRCVQSDGGLDPQVKRKILFQQSQTILQFNKPHATELTGKS
jgi:hypothetical protein